MNNTVTFANGVSFNTVNVLRYTQTIRSEDRTVLEFVLDGSTYTYEEVEAIYDNPDALKKLIISDFSVDEDGNVTENDFTYNNFDIPVSINKIKNNESTLIKLCVSQKTITEIQQEQIIQDNQDTQLALIELASMVSELTMPQEE